MPLPRSPRWAWGTSPLHPEGGWGGGLAPVAPTSHFPSSALATAACCQNTDMRPHRGPPKHPQVAAPSPPPENWWVPGALVAQHRPSSFVLPINAFILHPYQTSGRPRSWCSPRAVGKGQELGGIPAAPQQPPASQAHGQGREQMVPLGTAQHGMAQLLRPATSRSGQGSPATLASSRQRFGFPQGRSRCGCQPCQDCPMSPNPVVTHTRADTPQTFFGYK